jgi:hypothetical protein
VSARRHPARSARSATGVVAATGFVVVTAVIAAGARSDASSPARTTPVPAGDDAATTVPRYGRAQPGQGFTGYGRGFGGTAPDTSSHAS